MQTFFTYLCFTFYRPEFSLLSNHVGALWDLGSAHLTCFIFHHVHQHVLCAPIQESIWNLPASLTASTAAALVQRTVHHLPGLLKKQPRWGTHVNPWLIHVSVWQKPLQYCKVISLQLIKTNGGKKKPTWSGFPQVASPALPSFSLHCSQWSHGCSSGSPVYFGIKSRLLGSLVPVGSLPSSLSPSPLSVCFQMHSDTPSTWYPLPLLSHTLVPTTWSSLRWGHRSQACFSFLMAGLCPIHCPGVFASLWHCIVSPGSVFPFVQVLLFGTPAQGLTQRRPRLC